MESSRPRKPTAGLLVAGAVVGAAVAVTVWLLTTTSGREGRRSTTPSSRSPASTLIVPGREVWIFTLQALKTVMVSPAARTRLARGSIFELGNASSRTSQGLDVVPTRGFTSAATLSEKVARGLPAGVEAVLYDCEHWQFTPESEQLNIGSSTAEAVNAAHSGGLFLIVAPALNLARAINPATRQPNWQTFLQLDIAGQAAAHADAIDIQAQSLIRTPIVYRSFVEQAAAQARAANPHIVVLAGLSTNPPGSPLDPGVVGEAMKATRDVVSGWWMNVPQPGAHCPTCSQARPDFAVQALADPSTVQR